MQKAQVSINVLNFNTYEKTKRCIESALAQVGLDYVVLLIDNCSTDDSFEKLKAYFGNKVEYLRTPENYGFAKGNNIGVSYCFEKGIKYSLLLNSDTEIVGKDFLFSVTRLLSETENCAVIAPKISTVTHNGLIPQTNDSGYLKMLRFVGVIPQNRRLDDGYETLSVAHGSALLVDNKSFLDVDGFPEHYFMYYEELTFAKKILWSNKQIVSYYDDNKYVLHHHDKTGGTDPWRVFLMGRNGSLEYWENRKNHTRKWFFIYIFSLLKAWVVGKLDGNMYFYQGLIEGKKIYKEGLSKQECYKHALEMRNTIK